jgi:multidrug resistance efflux pump
VRGIEARARGRRWQLQQAVENVQNQIALLHARATALKKQAGYAKADADVQVSRAAIAAQRHQFEVLQGTVKQRAADLNGAKAGLAAAKLRLGYTKIVAPLDGVASARLVQPGDYVNIGTLSTSCRCQMFMW